MNERAEDVEHLREGCCSIESTGEVLRGQRRVIELKVDIVPAMEFCEYCRKRCPIEGESSAGPHPVGCGITGDSHDGTDGIQVRGVSWMQRDGRCTPAVRRAKCHGADAHGYMGD